MAAQFSPLGTFLRASRDRLTPAQAGIDPFPGGRRVPGLRKEELAHLAGLSTDHYSRIEQGRQPALGDDVVDALARALRLDQVERAHLRDLATPGRRRPEPWAATQRADAGMLRLMTALDHLPALLIGRRTEVLARTALLETVLQTTLPPGATFAHWLFLDPVARTRIANWSDFAAASVGALRFEQGRHPDDTKLDALIAQLRMADPDVARWWSDRRVADQTSLRKIVDHDTAGRLTFGIETVISPHDPEQRLVVYTVEPDSATAQALAMLTSWTPGDALTAGNPAGYPTSARVRYQERRPAAPQS